MKKSNKLYLLLLFLAPVFFSCDRDLESEGISRVTSFPTFKMEGDQFQSIVVGETYNEAGVTATEGGADLPVKISGSVDASTPGVYTINYSATNSDGFDGAVSRTVAVLPQAETPGVDISGDYANVGGNATTASFVNVVTKLAPGFYRASNVWGGTSAAVVPAYFFSTDGTTITLPYSALSGYGGVQGSGTLSASGLLEWSITLLDQGPLTSTRKWQKK